jgi:hypothetical protein
MAHGEKRSRSISQKMIGIICYGKQAYPANFSCFGALVGDINLFSDLNKLWKDRK